MTGSETSTPDIELRIHGVSGTPVVSMLDVSTVRRVAGDDDAGFWRRGEVGDADIPTADDTVLEGYRWGGLTSGAANAAVWVFLAPFALVNAAAAAHLPGTSKPEDRDGIAPGIEGTLVRVFALSLSLTFVLTAYISTVDVVGWQCGNPLDPKHAEPFCTRHPAYAHFLSWHFFDTPARHIVVTMLGPAARPRSPLVPRPQVMAALRGLSGGIRARPGSGGRTYAVRRSRVLEWARARGDAATPAHRRLPRGLERDGPVGSQLDPSAGPVEGRRAASHPWRCSCWALSSSSPRSPRFRRRRKSAVWSLIVAAAVMVVTLATTWGAELRHTTKTPTGTTISRFRGAPRRREGRYAVLRRSIDPRDAVWVAGLWTEPQISCSSRAGSA